MDKTETVSDNETIAIFYGGRVSMTYQNYTTVKDVNDLLEAKKHGWRANLYYDKSWDSLLPVVTKAKQAIKDAGWGTPLEKEAMKRLNAVLNEVYNINISAAHFCLLKFIQWYNSQPQQP